MSLLMLWMLHYLEEGPKLVPQVQAWLQAEHGASLVDANTALLIALRERRVETHGGRTLSVRLSGDTRAWPGLPHEPRSHLSLAVLTRLYSEHQYDHRQHTSARLH